MASPTFTPTDGLWVLALSAVLVVAVAVAMFVAGAYVTPAVLGTPNSVPREGLEKAAEAAILFAGMFFGLAVALAMMVIAARWFMAAETYARWQEQHEHSNLPRFPKVLSALFLRAIRPASRSDNAL
jgi:hypothetical protein